MLATVHALQFLRKTRPVNPEMLQDCGHIVVGAIQHFQQIVLDLNVVVRPCYAQTRGSLKRAPRCIVQLLNQTF